MEEGLYQTTRMGGFEGELCQGLGGAFSEERSRGLREEIKGATEGVLARGRHAVVVLSFGGEGGEIRVAVKAFGKQQRWKDRYDRKRGGKAARSFRAAVFLKKNGVGTPDPLGFLERWEGTRLIESYYFSEYKRGLTSLKSRLAELYEKSGPCEVLVDLLKKVGFAMKQMHDAGFCHRDLGAQNMELSEDGQVFFIDLNRSRIKDELTMKERAFDFARLRMPSGFLGVLGRIYWQAKAPSEFKSELVKECRRFDLRVKSRRWRHPIKSRRKRLAEGRSGALKAMDVWIWDRRSGQAAITLSGADRAKCQSLWSHFRIASATLFGGLGIWREYRKQMSGAFQNKVHLGGRLGMALEPADLDFESQLFFFKKLGKIPVLLRFGYHEGREQWDRTLEYLEKLHEDGHEVMVALLQDRQAVLRPDSWREFLEYILSRIEGQVEMVEICHVVNRVKWGIHNLSDYALLLEPMGELARKYPKLRFSGPACIDFEFHYVVGALKATPTGLNYGALSHHLYVDRRGAPENRQGPFGTVEKAALLKAIAVKSDRCGDEVIVSEVNWPIEGTGEWSPVAASYVLPGAKVSKVHVSEEEYGCFMLRYLVLTLCSGFVDQVYWWRLVSHGFGLIDERADEGWRERVGFQMLLVFLRELGNATFVEKLKTEEEVYALRFEREGDMVTMIWCNSRTFAGPWPGEYKKVLDASGEVIELTKVGDSPVYLVD